LILSVVIPTMNKCELLAQTLAALAGQDLGVAGTWEIVVVNDGSSDGTAAYLNSEIRNPDSRLVVVDPGQNVGRAKARNLGARQARGQFILFLDDDIVAPSGLLSAHLQILMATENCGTIGYAVTAGELIDAPHFYYMDSRGTARLHSGSAPARFFVTQNAAVPREAFLAIGGFDEDFSAYGFEDMEVAFRLEDETGLQFRALPNPVPVHVHHHTVGEYLAKKVECGRHSLPHLARLHPHRIAEMKLHHVVDTDGQSRPGLLTRMIRGFAGCGLGSQLPRLMAAWPTSGRSRPRFEGLYFNLMNLTVLCAYRIGMTESSAKD
jgi:glycosyltransferase involved in cell wall biosynthesis